jgi:hypothetical protein
MSSKIKGNREGRLRILGVLVVRNFNWPVRPTGWSLSTDRECVRPAAAKVEPVCRQRMHTSPFLGVCCEALKWQLIPH